MGWVGRSGPEALRKATSSSLHPCPLSLSLRVSPGLCRLSSCLSFHLSLFIPRLPVFCLSSPTCLCLTTSVSLPANLLHLSLSPLTPPHSRLPMASALGGHACVVRGCLSGQCQERRHHGQPVRHGDPAGNWHQQSPAQAQAAPCHSGDGVTHVALCACLLPHCECLQVHALLLNLIPGLLSWAHWLYST